MEPKRAQSTELIERLHGGKLRIERRNGSKNLYASAYLQGRNVVKSTGEETPNAARIKASAWFVEQLARIGRGEQLHAKTFVECAESFLRHADLHQEVSEGQRRNYRQKWSLLKSHFNSVKVTDIDAAFLVNLRDTRARSLTKQGKRISNSTLKKDLDFVRLCLRHAREWIKCIDTIPQFASFRGEKWTIVPAPRPFLDAGEWRKVRELAKKRAEEPGLNPRTQRQRFELYCFLMICVGAALRVEEAYSVRWRHCQLVRLGDEKKTQAVHMRVLGKHSRGGQREDAYGLYGAVSAYQMLKRARPDAKPDDPLFLEQHREGVKELLKLAGLRDTERGTRDSKSLRQTGISLRLELGPSPDYRDIAKWARTSPAMIAAFYDQTHPKQSVERIAGFRQRPRRRSPAKRGANIGRA